MLGCVLIVGMIDVVDSLPSVGARERKSDARSGHLPLADRAS